MNQVSWSFSQRHRKKEKSKTSYIFDSQTLIRLIFDYPDLTSRKRAFRCQNDSNQFLRICTQDAWLRNNVAELFFWCNSFKNNALGAYLITFGSKDETLYVLQNPSKRSLQTASPSNQFLSCNPWYLSPFVLSNTEHQRFVNYPTPNCVVWNNRKFSTPKQVCRSKFHQSWGNSRTSDVHR